MLSPAPIAPTLKIGFYRTSSIGDTVLATACLNLLGHLKVPTEVYWIGREPALNLLKAAYPKMHCFEINRSDSLKQLLMSVDKLASLHLMVDLQSNLRSHWFCKTLSKTHNTIIFTHNKLSAKRSKYVWLARLRGRKTRLNREVIQPDMLQYEQMCETLLKALRFHLPEESLDGVAHCKPHPLLPLDSKNATQPWLKELKLGNWLAVSPGAAHITKQAPVEIFKDILLHLKKILEFNRLAVGIVFLGDERDRDFALQLIDHISWPHGILNLAGKLTLTDTALALKQATVLLSNDSALSHIAEAVDTPAAVLFGPTIEAFGFAPRKKESRAFSSDLGCRPCSKHGKTDCRYQDKLCFWEIPKTQVSDYLYNVLCKTNGEAKDF